MAKKLTYKEVKKAFEDRGYILLDTVYINSRSKLRYLCSIHGEKSIKYNDLYNGKGCGECGASKSIDSRKHSMEFILDEFSKRGYTLQETMYVNANTKMNYKCNMCNTNQSIRYNDLQRGHGCMKCGSRSCGDTMRLTIDNAMNVFIKANFTLLESKYIDSHTPMKCICNTCGQEASKTYSSINYGYGCSKCFYDNNKGKGNPRWLGGIKELNDYLRDNIKQWTVNALNDENYTCAISGIRNGTKAVHHQYSFNKIVKETLAQLSLPVLQTIGEYSEEELRLLTETFMTNNASHPYAVLSDNIHRLYHSIYGTNNDEQQFQEFRERYDSGEFTEQLNTPA